MSTDSLKAAVGLTPEAPATQQEPQSLHAFLTAYKSEIARALPKHLTADRLARVALTEVRKTPMLGKCAPRSLFGAIMQCAQLGLEPGGALGHAYLLPFRNKTGGYDVQFIVGYRGMIDLARRSGQIVSIEAHAVYPGDHFDCEFGLDSKLVHRPDWDVERNNPQTIRFVYAVAKLQGGGVQFEVMSKAQVDSIRARSKSSGNGPWVTDFEPMALKTVIRRMFKYLPVSIEVQRAVGLDEMAEAGVNQDNGMVFEGESVPVDDPAAEEVSQ
jgi:recombination protein RecT